MGPLARYTLNSDRLSADRPGRPRAKPGSGDTCRNPFRSIIVRAVEIVERLRRGAADHRRLASTASSRSVAVPPRAGDGFGASEAPRGVLFHRYVLDAAGIITDAQIVPPTSQNQPSIEADLRTLVAGLDRPRRPRAAAPCEHAIRNYDPCISCATHFLDLTVERT